MIMWLLLQLLDHKPPFIGASGFYYRREILWEGQVLGEKIAKNYFSFFLLGTQIKNLKPRVLDEQIYMHLTHFFFLSTKD